MRDDDDERRRQAVRKKIMEKAIIIIYIYSILTKPGRRKVHKCIAIESEKDWYIDNNQEYRTIIYILHHG